jgi:hypothetical protein
MDTKPARFVRLSLLALAVLALNSHEFSPAVRAAESEKASAGLLTNAQSLAGAYYRGDGLSYNLDLILRTNGEYTAKWHSCLYKSGEASGSWSLSGRLITFTPPLDGEMLRGQLKAVELRQANGEWELVPTDGQGERAHDQNGVTPKACFQRSELAGTWEFGNGAMGEFHTLYLCKDRTFSWEFKDEALQLHNTYSGNWQINKGALQLSILAARSKSGDSVIPRDRLLTLSVAPDLQSLSTPRTPTFRLERTDF